MIIRVTGFVLRGIIKSDKCMRGDKMSYSVIGGADGPTSVFLAGKIGFNWINVFGLILVLLLLIPNIIYALKLGNHRNECNHKVMNILEQIGRYASVFFMIFSIGIAEFGFSSLGAFFLYGIGNIVLMLTYWIVWMLYFHKQDLKKAMALAVIPACIFVLSGAASGHILLVASGVVFAIGHIYITYQNGISERGEK